MQNRWYRTGEFYQLAWISYKGSYFSIRPENEIVERNRVRFTNAAYAVVIREIRIKRYSDGKVSLALEISPFFYNEFLSVIKNYLSEDEYRVKMYSGIIEFIIPSFSNQILKKINNLFAYFNKLKDAVEFTQELLTELQQIITICEEKSQDVGISGQHIISEMTFKDVHINPSVENAKSLVTYMKDGSLSRSRYHFDELQKYLIKGHDPNQIDSWDFATPLECAVLYYSLSEIELLLFYGANPFTQGSQLSAIELAKQNNKMPILNYILDAYTNPRKSLSDKLSITGIGLDRRQKHIITRFKFNDESELYTDLTRLNQLLTVEQEQLYYLFQYTFKHANQNEKLKHTFKEDFSQDDDTWIERIYNKKHELIGYNLYKLIALNKNATREAHLIIEWVYAIMLPSYRGTHINLISAFRFAFSLQQLAPDDVVGIYFSAIDYNSYRLTESFLHDPKNQSDYTTELRNQIIHDVYDNKIQLIQDGTLLCYGEERHPLQINTEEKNIKSNGNKKMFNQYLRGYADGVPDKENSRFTPVITLVADDSFNRIQNLLSKNHLNFSAHVVCLTKLLKPMLLELVGQNLGKQYKGLARSEYLFWQKKIIIEEQPQNKTNQIGYTAHL